MSIVYAFHHQSRQGSCRYVASFPARLNRFITFLAWYDPTSSAIRRWGGWLLFESYGCAASTYAFAASTGGPQPGQLDPVYLTKCESEIVAAGNDTFNRGQDYAYGNAFPLKSKGLDFFEHFSGVTKQFGVLLTRPQRLSRGRRLEVNEPEAKGGIK
jgi:hypothetical protein